MIGFDVVTTHVQVQPISVITDNVLLNHVVTVSSARGNVTCVVVGDFGDVVTVCQLGEAAAARNEGRPARFAGIKRADIVGVSGLFNE